ncbi:MAG: class I SAM-dependent methyltransferase [Candidatus Chisholmbacteria bacterium]|nr:class I SAM-dependent methyltransferase [Candidatus Chisholmbacteria bacterium]
MFFHWHPQLALRYLPIVNMIKSLPIKNPTILEVGSGSLGIGPYLNKPFTAVDLDFSGPQWKKAKKIIASATKLPFPDNHFDVVLSVDMLEHLKPEDRNQAVTEMLRVAKTTSIIALPVGKLAAAQDKHLDSLYQKKFGHQFPFLKEQVNYGLPETADVRRWITTAARNTRKEISIQTSGNRNLRLRSFLMQGWMNQNLLVNIFFRKILLIFLPLLALIDKRPPHYRQIFFVKIH